MKRKFRIKPIEFRGVSLNEIALHNSCFIANGSKSKRGRANPYIGTSLGNLHLNYLCDFSRFTFLNICDLSNNYLTNIEPLSCCLNLIWLDIHGNHIEELPEEFFWAGMVSLRILNAHDNPLSMLVNIKYLSSCRNLEVLTLYDSPVAVHPFYRHCCVNKLSSLKALDHHVIADDEVVEGFIASVKFTKCNSNLRLKLTPEISDGMSSVFAVIRKVNRLQAKFSPCLFIQRVFRGYRVRTNFQMIIATAKKRATKYKLSAKDIFSLPALLQRESNTTETESSKNLDGELLPPLIPPTTPQFSRRSDQTRTATSAPSYATLRIIFHKLSNSSLLDESEDVIDAIRSRRMSSKLESYIRDTLSMESDTARKSKETVGNVAVTFSKRGLGIIDEISLEQSQMSNGEDSFELPTFRVSTSNQTGLFQMRQLEGQIVKEAEAEFHSKNRLDKLNELKQKQEKVLETKPVNMNAVYDRVNAEEQVTQQLACLAAVEKAYHERKVREVHFEKASSILHSREVTTQAIQRGNSIVCNNNEIIGNEMRAQRHLTHLLIEKLKEQDIVDKRDNYSKQVNDRVGRRGKMVANKTVSDLRQRFSAISASINKYDWVNRQQGLLEHSRAIVENVQQSQQAASIVTTEKQRKRNSETTALNQLEIRRGHAAMDAAAEVDMELARKRVEKVKNERPERYPPQLPGPGSMAIDGIKHAAYNPIVGSDANTLELGVKLETEISKFDREKIVDINERWRILAGVPNNRIGLHPITAEIK